MYTCRPLCQVYLAPEKVYIVGTEGLGKAYLVVPNHEANR